MGKRNYLVEGVSGSGKSSVCEELKKRGYSTVDGDKELAHRGDPETGKKINKWGHSTHIWNVSKVKELISDNTSEMSFFCGGSRNFKQFIDLFDEVFVLDADNPTISERLSKRPGKNAWGKNKSQRDLVLKLNETKEDIPRDGININSMQPLEKVVDEIIRHIEKI